MALDFLARVIRAVLPPAWALLVYPAREEAIEHAPAGCTVFSTVTPRPTRHAPRRRTALFSPTVPSLSLRSSPRVQGLENVHLELFGNEATRPPIGSAAAADEVRQNHLDQDWAMAHAANASRPVHAFHPAAPSSQTEAPPRFSCLGQLSCPLPLCCSAAAAHCQPFAFSKPFVSLSLAGHGGAHE